MPEYRRWRVAGATYFFTAVTLHRRPLFENAHAIALLGRAFREERKRRPFRTDAVVLLPDHFHLMMTLPDGDDDYSTRMNQIKRRFTISLGAARSNRPGRRRKRLADVWHQRFWEHVTRSDDEREAFANYIHYNPVKHGYVRCPHEWRWSSFHRWVQCRWLEPDWSCSCNAPAAIPYTSTLSDLCGEPE